MGLPPIVGVTIQSSVLAATSNILAQALTAYRSQTAFSIDWIPVFQFLVITLVNTPPNFLWQVLLEETWPASHIAPTAEAVSSASAGDEKELDKEAREGRLVEPQLNVRNTLIKAVVDQTLASAVNTTLFCLWINAFREAMSHRPEGAEHSAAFLLSGSAIQLGQVDWAAVVRRSQAEIWPIMKAGWRLWPLVSVVNFAFVKSVQTRNLIGGLAGLAWGIYMSLFA